MLSQLLTPEANELISHLNIKIADTKTFIEEYPGEINENYKNYMLSCLGFYCPAPSRITLTPSLISEAASSGRMVNPTLVLLHEIGHWTGGPDALNRDIFVKQKINNELYMEGKEMIFHFNREENDTEELIAHLIMLELSKYLEIDQVKTTAFFYDFVSQWPCADQNMAREEAKKGTDYIMSVIKNNLARAA